MNTKSSILAQFIPPRPRGTPPPIFDSVLQTEKKTKMTRDVVFRADTKENVGSYRPPFNKIKETSYKGKLNIIGEQNESEMIESIPQIRKRQTNDEPILKFPRHPTQKTESSFFIEVIDVVKPRRGDEHIEDEGPSINLLYPQIEALGLPTYNEEDPSQSRNRRLDLVKIKEFTLVEMPRPQQQINRKRALQKQKSRRKESKLEEDKADNIAQTLSPLISSFIGLSNKRSNSSRLNRSSHSSLLSKRSGSIFDVMSTPNSEETRIQDPQVRKLFESTFLNNERV